MKKLVIIASLISFSILAPPIDLGAKSHQLRQHAPQRSLVKLDLSAGEKHRFGQDQQPRDRDQRVREEQRQRARDRQIQNSTRPKQHNAISY